LVAEVRRVLRQDAEAEETEDRLVLLLEPELEVGLVVVEIVEVGHSEGQCTRARRAWIGPFPGTSSAGATSASGSSTKDRSWSLGCGTRRPGSSISASPYTRR